MEEEGKDNKQIQNTKNYWAKGVSDVNFKFIALFSSKIILTGKVCLYERFIKF